MAPARKDGEKENKLSPQEAARAILDYLRKTNRPYSPTEVSGNLKIGLTVAKKLLKDMHERQEIACCASGKQQVYHIIQDEVPADHSEQLRAMNTETTKLAEITNALRSEERDLRAKLRDSSVSVPLPQLKADIEGREKQKSDLELRLKSLRDGNLKPVDGKERERITKSYTRAKHAAVQRRKIRSVVWKIFLDAHQGQNEEELKEQFGMDF